MKALRTVTLFILAAAAIFAVVFMHRISSHDWTDPVSLLFGLWAISPLAFLSFMTMILGKRLPQLLTMLIGATTLSLWGIYSVIEVWYLIPLDPQSALVFMAVPLGQWIGGSLVVGIAFVLSLRFSSKPTITMGYHSSRLIKNGSKNG